MKIRICNCGSGLEAWFEHDARGIPLCLVCVNCKEKKLKKFRKDVIIDPNYESNEPIEEDE